MKNISKREMLRRAKQRQAAWEKENPGLNKQLADFEITKRDIKRAGTLSCHPADSRYLPMGTP